MASTPLANSSALIDASRAITAGSYRRFQNTAPAPVAFTNDRTTSTALPRAITAVAVSILLLLVPQVKSVGGAIALMAAVSFCGDLTVPISWNTCVEIGKRYTATMGASMNMFANFSGFVAPVLGGMILAQSGNDWSLLLYLMSGVAACGAVCWLFINVSDEKPIEAIA